MHGIKSKSQTFKSEGYNKQFDHVTIHEITIDTTPLRDITHCHSFAVNVLF